MVFPSHPLWKYCVFSPNMIIKANANQQKEDKSSSLSRRPYQMKLKDIQWERPSEIYKEKRMRPFGVEFQCSDNVEIISKRKIYRKYSWIFNDGKLFSLNKVFLLRSPSVVESTSEAKSLSNVSLTVAGNFSANQNFMCVSQQISKVFPCFVFIKAGANRETNLK